LQVLQMVRTVLQRRNQPEAGHPNAVRSAAQAQQATEVHLMLTIGTCGIKVPLRRQWMPPMIRQLVYLQMGKHTAARAAARGSR
jgi:hypothetical protein